MEAQSVILLSGDEINLIKGQLHRIETGLKKSIHDINSEYLYTDEEFCQIMKCSKKTAQNWRNRGFLGYVQLGAFIRYRKGDILALCEKFQVKPDFKG